MGKMTGDRASSQANATCDGVTFFRAATRRRGLSAPVSWPAAKGNHGMKTMSCCSQYSSTSSAAAIGHAIAILDARDRHDRARVMKLAHAHFR